ncbi:MAG: PAC2 family protein [Candidatus Diapherotrites archaeon]|nr:PAC2 family protein [Candidatus Diapherotrites archaeon]
MDTCTVCFVEKEKVDLKGYTLIEGFPGIGLVGTIAAKYLLEKMQFEYSGHVECSDFAPVIRVHKGIPLHPARIYVNSKNKLAVLIAEQMIESKTTETLAEKMVAWIKSKNIKRVISIAGIHAEGTASNEVYGIASHSESLKELEKFGVKIIEDGLTTGVTALILLKLNKEKTILAYSLLGNVNLTADYKTAAVIIEKLNAILGLNIDAKPLLEEAKSMEELVKKQINQIKETQEKTEKYMDKGPQMYA